MDPLTARWTDERVVVQRRDDRDPAAPRELRQLEREVQQAVHVQDVGLYGAQDLCNAARDERRPVRLLER